MEKIKLTFLGTGDAVPTKKRNHTAVLASFADENILIDCGEGTQRQLKIAEISPAKITRILLTHWHGDHFLGIPGLLETLRMHKYKKTLKIYGPKGTKKHISLLIGLIGGQKVKLEIKEVEGIFIKEPKFSIEAQPMSHGTPANAYSITLKEKIRLNKAKLKKLKLPNSPIIKKLQEGKTISYKGKKISPKQVAYFEKGKKITIIMDTKSNPNAVKIAKNSNLLICESTFSSKEARRASEYKHLTAKQAAEIAKKAKVKSLILTHISQRYDKSQKIIEKEAKKIFRNTRLAKDFDKIDI